MFSYLSDLSASRMSLFMTRNTAINREVELALQGVLKMISLSQNGPFYVYLVILGCTVPVGRP